MPQSFLSCDWGTSSFRLRWFRQGEVFREYRDENGCRTIYEEARASGDLSEASRSRWYAEFLSCVLDQWRDPVEGKPLPLVISGMASSTIGWRELPYGGLPLKLDGSTLRFETLAWEKPSWLGETYLISGIASDREIMRGEETEAVGILHNSAAPADCLLLLPGTHSKHLRVKEGQIVDFCTYITGELFEILARHSILRATTDLSALGITDAAHLAAFDDGVRQAQVAGLASSIFQTRTRSILKGVPPGENTWFLSGLLIGSELADAQASAGAFRWIVGGPAKIRWLYARALNVLGADRNRWEELSAECMELAVCRGHAKFLKVLGYGE